MAGSSIEAGRAFLKLLIDDKDFAKGLDAGILQLESFGKSAAKVGATIGAAGAALTAPFVASLKIFSDVGGAFKDMGDRTGLSVEAMSELSFAAKQTGTSLEVVEKAAREMQDQGIDPNKIGDYARKIASIEDPTKRAQAAFELFGKKAGSALLPLLSQLPALQDLARKSGLLWSKEMVDNADNLGDAFGLLKEQSIAVAAAIANAVAPAVTAVAEKASKAVAQVIEFIHRNQELVTIIGGTGAAMTGLGATIGGLGLALNGLASAFGAVKAASLFLLANPLVLALGAIAAGVYGVAYATGEMETKFKDFGKTLDELVSDKKNRVRELTAEVEKLSAASYTAGDNTMEGAANDTVRYNLQLAKRELQQISFDALKAGKLPFGFGPLGAGIGGTPFAQKSGPGNLLFGEAGNFPSFLLPGMQFAIGQSLTEAFEHAGRQESHGLRGFDTPAQKTLEDFAQQTRPLLATFNGRLAGQVFGGGSGPSKSERALEAILAQSRKQTSTLEGLDKTMRKAGTFTVGNA